jgi:hypothetical protein
MEINAKEERARQSVSDLRARPGNTFLHAISSWSLRTQLNVGASMWQKLSPGSLLLNIERDSGDSCKATPLRNVGGQCLGVNC